jgi:preflagellin peptidase FlaK
MVLVSVLLVGLRYRRRGTLEADPYTIANVGVAVALSWLAVVGLFDGLEAFWQPVSGVLVSLVGTPARWAQGLGMDVARYTPTDLLRVAVVIPVFVYASYRDIRERIVRNWVWEPLFAYGLVFLLYDLLTGSVQTLAPWVLGNFLFATLVGLALYKARIMGGADMKALWGLGLIFPTYPALSVAPRVLPPVLAAPQNALNLFALTILANTALVALAWPVYTFGRNLLAGEFVPTRPGMMITARRVDIETAIDTHGRILPVWAFRSTSVLGRISTLVQFIAHGFDTEFVREYVHWHRSMTSEPLESVSDIDSQYVERFLESDANTDTEGNRKWEASDEAQAVEAFEQLLAQERVWMTPGIPFLVPMSLGVLLSLTLGDIIYWLVIALN